jgi:hypothetical protein
MAEKSRSFLLPMPMRSSSALERVVVLLALALAIGAPASASKVRMVCLVVDLEGDGLRLGDKEFPVDFDVDGDGLQERVQWTAEEQREAFLWLDANHDHNLQPGELVGRRLATPEGPSRKAGWRALADLDSKSAGGNGDGRLTKADRAWSDLRLWIDYDHDADPSKGELYRLEDWRIESFQLDFAEGLKVDGGLNLETAWAGITVRPAAGAEKETAGGKSAGGKGVVTEVHLPLLSVPTAVATPVPLA